MLQVRAATVCSYLLAGLWAARNLHWSTSAHEACFWRHARHAFADRGYALVMRHFRMQEAVICLCRASRKLHQTVMPCNQVPRHAVSLREALSSQQTRSQ